MVMASVRFGGIVIGVIIVSQLALKYSTACAHHEGSRREGKWPAPAGIAPQNHASSETDVNEETSVAEVVNNIGGRKGLRGGGSHMRPVDHVVSNTEAENMAPASDNRKLSGNYAFKDSKEAVAHDQNHHLMKPQVNTSKMSKEPSQKSSTASSSHGGGSGAFVSQAADKVVTLVRKDYSGRDLRPRRKPPINNHQPNN